MRGIGDYIVVYDISKNSERVKVSKILKEFGFRIQKSVFECKMDKSGKKNLLKKLEALKIKTGFIKIYKEEYSINDITVGNSAKENHIDDDNAYII